MRGFRSFRSKLQARTTVGVVLQSASPLVANSLSAAGFDWLVIDPLHSPISQTEAFGMLTAIGDANPTPVLMRVGGPSDRSGIQQATDTGAAGILVPSVRSADDIVMARRPTRYPPVGDRSLFAPVRAHHKEGVQVHFFRANSTFVVAIQLEKAPRESWDELLTHDFHVAVLDIPQLCVGLGLYDGLLAAPPEGDGRLASRLEPWLRVYQQPCAELSDLVKHFAELCRKHGKVAGALLGDHAAAPLYQSLGVEFIGIGTDVMVLMERAAAAIEKQRADTSHDWTPARLDCAADERRSGAFWELLQQRAPFVGSILIDGSYEATRAVRPAPVVLVDCFREGLNTPRALGSALRSLDGLGHRLVRVPSVDPKDTPMTAAVALALGADSVVVPVGSAAEARAVRAASSYKGSRVLNIGPELPYHVAKVAAAGVELLEFPHSEFAEIVAAADFVMASAANFVLAYGPERALTILASLQEACAKGDKPFLLLDDSPPEEQLGDQLRRFEQRISLAPASQSEDVSAAAQNDRLAEFQLGLRRGAKSLGQLVASASPAVAASYVAAGADWIWIEWQHSCQDAGVFRAQVAAIAQRGGLSIARTAGAHDKVGIQQCLDAGVDILLVPYVSSVADVQEAIRHCLFAPRGDRVWNGSALSHAKKSALMFQIETSACIDALAEICRQPELDFCVVGPGDLAMSMGLLTRDSLLGYMKADELKWCFSYILETCTAAGKIAGGFTRGGDPSTLLAHGFSMVALSHDLMDAMMGAESIMTGAIRAGGVPVKTAPNLTRLRKWSRNPSKLVPTTGFIGRTLIPAVISHLWSVKRWGARPTLILPKVMPANVRGAIDMENTPRSAKP
jgi:4-hydroxy-2-oxoheptanedioate aldolase